MQPSRIFRLQTALKPSSILFLFFLLSYQQVVSRIPIFSVFFFSFISSFFHPLFDESRFFFFFFLQFVCEISIENRNLSSIYRPQPIYSRYISDITDTIPKIQATDYHLYISFRCRPISYISSIYHSTFPIF